MVKQVVPGMSQPINNLSYVSTLSKSDSQHADKIENAYSFQESAFVGVIGYSDHDCDRFEKNSNQRGYCRDHYEYDRY